MSTQKKKKLSADQIVLKEIVSQLHQQQKPDQKINDFFERFTADLILKDYELSFEEIENGIVGAGGDGGTDSIYQFVQGILTDEDAVAPKVSKGAEFQLHFIQSKYTSSMGAVPLKHLQDVFEDLFDISNDLGEKSDLYNDRLINKAYKFREFFLKLAPKSPQLQIHFHYATIAHETHPDVVKRADKLRQKVQEVYSSASINVHFYTAQKLIDENARIPTRTHTLKVSHKLSANDESVVALTKLTDFYDFISEDGKILTEIFEENIRDYQGNITVNKEISATLKNVDSDDFWYLNNGVTVLTSKIGGGGNIVSIDDPQIVNGLQTSTEIFNYFAENPELSTDARMVLVRALLVTDDDVKDRIIKATNSQSNIPAVSLRGSDNIHHLIEEYFKHHSYFYDRKKNKYKNLGKPADRIFSIPFLAQAVMSAVLGRPDTARARPSTLLNSELDYKRVFADNRAPEVYLNAATLARRIESVLRKIIVGSDARKTINNIKWYVLFYFVKNHRGSKSEEEYLSSITVPNITHPEIVNAINVVQDKYIEKGASDQIAKGSELKKLL